MTLNEYMQIAAGQAYGAAARDNVLGRMAYLALGLAGEAGESADCIKKIIRTGSPADFEAQSTKLFLELGDVLWYWISLCRVFEFDPDEVMAANVIKLNARKAKREDESNIVPL